MHRYYLIKIFLLTLDCIISADILVEWAKKGMTISIISLQRSLSTMNNCKHFLSGGLFSSSRETDTSWGKYSLDFLANFIRSINVIFKYKGSGGSGNNSRSKVSMFSNRFQHHFDEIRCFMVFCHLRTTKL